MKRDSVAISDIEVRYERAVHDWARLRETHPQLSAPLLLNPPSEYFSLQNRLMIVGQETLGWGEELSADDSTSDLVAALRSGYSNFALGAGYRSTPFWAAANQLFKVLNPAATTRCYLWSNLVKMDDAGRRPNAELERVVADLGLLEAEIESYDPQVVIFFTGPYYDARLVATFPGAELVRHSKPVARLVHPNLPTRTFRTYHPRYLRMSRQWHALDEIADRCAVQD